MNTAAKIESQKLELLGQMSASVLHDIKGPLAYIKSNNKHMMKKLFALKEETTESENKLIDYLLNILQENEDGLLHVQEILFETTTLIKADKFITTSLHEVISSCCKLAKIHIGQVCHLELHLDAANDFICAIPSQLRQVILNLIINACEAFPEKADENKVIIATSSKNNQLSLSIADNGSGIPQKMLNSIFGWYVTSKENGTGQGLAISKEILTNHGAAINCKSKIGQGTKFIIEFDLNFKALPSTA